MNPVHPRWLVAQVRSHPACRSRTIDPDDLLSEVTLRLLQRKRFPNVDRQAARWALADSLRYLRRHGRDVPTAPERLAPPTADTDMPSEGASRIIVQRRVCRTLAGLPSAQREIARLRILGGKTEREISKQVGLSTATVHRRYVAARTELLAAIQAPHSGTGRRR